MKNNQVFSCYKSFCSYYNKKQKLRDHQFQIFFYSLNVSASVFTLLSKGTGICYAIDLTRCLVSGGSSMRKPVTVEGKTGESGYAPTLSGKAKETNLTIKKQPTFTDKFLNDTDNTRPEGRHSKIGQQIPWLITPTAFTSTRGNSGRTIASTKMETEVDKWEIAKMERIRQR